MEFEQTLIGTLAAALITGLVVAWWKEHSRFKVVGTILFVGLCVLWGASTLYGVVYADGAVAQWKADQGAIGASSAGPRNAAQHTVKASAAPVVSWKLPAPAQAYLLLLIAILGFLL